MANPSPGEIEIAFNRMYVVVNPNPLSGPPTYRISNPDEISGGGGGIVDIDGVEPIFAATDGATNRTEISMDIRSLDNRDST